MLKAVAGASAIAISLGYSCRGLEYDPLLAKPQLLSSIWDTKTMTAIGKHYQKLYPNEYREANLVNLLSEGVSTKGVSLAESMEERIKEDYKVGKIILLDGWILSLTEGRQCALFSLLQAI